MPPGPTPPDLLDEQLTFIPPVLFDTAPSGTDFGDCTVPPPATVNRGDVVRVDFVRFSLQRIFRAYGTGGPKRKPSTKLSFADHVKHSTIRSLLVRYFHKITT